MTQRGARLATTFLPNKVNWRCAVMLPPTLGNSLWISPLPPSHLPYLVYEVFLSIFHGTLVHFLRLLREHPLANYLVKNSALIYNTVSQIWSWCVRHGRVSCHSSTRKSIYCFNVKLQLRYNVKMCMSLKFIYLVKVLRQWMTNSDLLHI